MAKINAFTYEAQPVPVRYRPQNIMNDPRVRRGPTVPSSQKLNSLNGTEKLAKTVQQHNQPKRQRQKSFDFKIIDDTVVPPVEGRQHCSMQTDVYLEDLRPRPKHDQGAQTDAVIDKPSEVIFKPRSSGEDIGTQIEAGDLFDFELEVQPILHVLTSRSLEQALLEVLEEEELRAIEKERLEYECNRNRRLVEVQRLQGQDARREEERKRRIDQEQSRIEDEKKQQEMQLTAAIAKDLMDNILDAVIANLEQSGFFSDPVRNEVEKLFVPWLTKTIDGNLQHHRETHKHVDSLLREAVRRVQEQQHRHLTLKGSSAAATVVR